MPGRLHTRPPHADFSCDPLQEPRMRSTSLALIATLALAGAAPAVAQTSKPAAKSPQQQAKLRTAVADVRLRQQADRGDAAAMVELGLRETGKNNDAEAVKWFTKAAELKNTEGLFYLGYAYLEGSGGLKADEAKALELLEQAAKAGHPSAMLFCGMIREEPRTVPRDDTKAAYWYSQAAKHNVPFALRRLGQFHMSGRGGLAKDPKAAARWFARGAEAGDAPSLTAIAMMHVDGIGGFKQDHAEAVRLFGVASEAGDNLATSMLAHAYLDGDFGLKQDRARSTKLFWAAAKRGHAHSMTMLAVAYADGVGTPVDNESAANWFEQAVALGDTDAMLLFGDMLAEGRGVERHEARALHLFQTAADRGSTTALIALAEFHSEGKGGLNPDKARGFALLKQAADQKHPLAYGQIAIAYTDGLGVDRNPALAESFYRLAIKHMPNATNKGKYAWMLLGEGRTREGLKMLDEAFAAMHEQTSDALRAECWFYVLAFRPEKRDEALGQLLTLVNDKDARSEGWNFSRVISQAVKSNPKHPDAKHLATLADVISGKADSGSLAQWPAWQQAAESRTATVPEAN
jgi:TPR repeat protein